jgi:ribosomal protein S8
MPSILNIANMCSHLQNASKARLGITSIPNNKFNLSLALAMHRAGFFSAVYRGGPTPPTLDQMLTEQPEKVTHANVATRRIWLGLKYWEGKPVLSKANALSKPSRLLTCDEKALGRLSRGLSAKIDGGVVQGLSLGECIFVSTERGTMEAREALSRKLGGTLLCRTS